MVFRILGNEITLSNTPKNVSVKTKYVRIINTDTTFHIITLRDTLGSALGTITVYNNDTVLLMKDNVLDTLEVGIGVTGVLAVGISRPS